MFIPALVSIVLSAATAVYADAPLPPLSNSFSGSGTFYSPTQDAGIGACAWKNTTAQWVVAIAFQEYDGFPGATPNPNNNPICGQRVQISAGGATFVVAEVVDKCLTCPGRYDVDMSPQVWTQGLLLDEAKGRTPITWVYVPKTTNLGQSKALPGPAPPDTSSPASSPPPPPPSPPARRSLRRVRRRLAEESDGIRALPSERSTTASEREASAEPSGAPGDPIESRNHLSTHVDAAHADNPVPRYVPRSPRAEDLRKRMANVQPRGPIESGNHLSKPHVDPTVRIHNPDRRHVPRPGANDLKKRMAEDQDGQPPSSTRPGDYKPISERRMLKFAR